MRATLIHNQGGGSATQEAIERARLLLALHFELEVRSPEPGQSPTELARQAIDAGSTLLIASGGDGTVSSVAAAAVGKSGVSLGIIPQGTANSIAAYLGIPSDVGGACAVIIAGNEHLLDSALVNGRTMLLMATLGIHAEAITGADPEQKRKYGVLAYLLEEASRMLDDSLFDVVIDTGEERFSCRASAVTIANLAPPSSLFAQGPASIVDNDGMLDVTLIAFEGLGSAIATSIHLATHALAGLPANRENIGFFRASSIRVETAQPRRFMVDGEDAGETPFEVRCVPRSLRVRVP